MKKHHVPPPFLYESQIPLRFSTQYHLKDVIQGDLGEKHAAKCVFKSQVIAMILHLKIFKSTKNWANLDLEAPLSPSGDINYLPTCLASHHVHNDALNEMGDSRYLFNSDNSHNDDYDENIMEQFLSQSGELLIHEDRQMQHRAQEFIPAHLRDEEDLDTEMEDPIPPEYQPERFGQMINTLQFSRVYSNQSTDHYSPSIGTSESQVSSIDGSATSENPLSTTYGPSVHQRPQRPQTITAERLAIHNEVLTALEQADERYGGVPEKPYSFMEDPYHTSPESGYLDNDCLQLYCPDGCVDCEVIPKAVSDSKYYVTRWFEEYFTREDALALLRAAQEGQTQQNGPDNGVETDGNPNTVSDDVDYLIGATDSEELAYFQRLKGYQQPSEMTPGDLVLGNMLHGAFVESSIFPYFHGPEYNMIVAQYEPRYIPSVGISSAEGLCVPIEYPGDPDTDLPIWEARGRPLPGQGEDGRMAYTQREYDRQWVMYRAFDDARMRYVAAVMRDAAHELGLAA